MKIFRHDFQTDNGATGLSVEDKEALASMRSSIKLNDGHYTVSLPWKHSNVTQIPHPQILKSTKEVGQQFWWLQEWAQQYSTQVVYVYQQVHRQDLTWSDQLSELL